MTVAARKERQKEELKGKILQSARELFMEHGYENTSIRNIAEKIEYSPTTIYLHFKDKDEIFYALHQEGFIRLNKYFEVLVHVTDPFERLKAISKAYIAFAMENSEYYDLMFILRSPMKSLDKSDARWQEGDRAFAFVVHTIQECQHKGYFKGFDPEIFAFTVWSMVHGICSLQIRNRCSVLSEEKQEGLAEKASEYVIQVLEKMNKPKK